MVWQLHIATELSRVLNEPKLRRTSRKLKYNCLKLDRFKWLCSTRWDEVISTVTCKVTGKNKRNLLLPIALRPFQFGLGFLYNWCPFPSFQCFRSPSFHLYPYFVCVVVLLHPSCILYMVSEQFNFSGVGLLAPCPPPSILEDWWFSVRFVSLSWPVPILKRQELAFRPYMT